MRYSTLLTIINNKKGINNNGNYKKGIILEMKKKSVLKLL